MAKKFYGVKVGFQTGVFDSWDECQKQVAGCSGAVFKGFATKEDAEDYVAGRDFETACKEKTRSATSTAFDDNSLHLYVDGSYCDNTKEYGMGFLVIKDNSIVMACTSKNNKEEYLSARNVSGEVSAAETAILAAYRKYSTNFKLVVHHDYEGIGKWATHEWKANKPLTQNYQDFITKMKDKGVDLDFVHVKGHSGDRYNELADVLARCSLNLLSPAEQEQIADLADVMIDIEEIKKGAIGKKKNNNYER